MTCYWDGEDQWGPKTKSGRLAEINRTIAVDPCIIPLGSEVLIDGQVYIAEDIGGAIKGSVIDVWAGTEDNSFGVKYTEVYIKKIGGN